MEVVNPVIKRWRHQAETDFEGFWARAAEAVPWFRKWETVFESTPPTFRWFSGPSPISVTTAWTSTWGGDGEATPR